MSIHRLLAISLFLVVPTACNPFRHDPAVQVNTDDAALNSRWHANLASPAELAGVVQMNGSASMAPDKSGKSTTVTIDLANASPGGVHPWELRRGQCGAGTDYGLFGTGAAFRPLEVASDGHAHETATVSLRTPTTGSYFIVVLASVANPEVVVACGNLAPPTR
jgi:hypothetical protein